jgi:hypothetical protein
MCAERCSDGLLWSRGADHRAELASIEERGEGRVVARDADSLAEDRVNERPRDRRHAPRHERGAALFDLAQGSVRERERDGAEQPNRVASMRGRGL